MSKDKGVELSETIGKTIKEYKYTWTMGPYGREPKVKIIFTDGTFTSFVLHGDS